MELENVRGRIRAIDRELARLIGERVEAAAEAGRLKRRAGLPLRDYEAERVVVEHYRATVGRHHVDAELGERVARLLIEASLRVQENEAGPSASPHPATRDVACIVGGAGRMGRWFATYLAARGYRVVVNDPAGPVEGFEFEPDLERAAAAAALVLVSVPPDRTRAILEKLDGLPGLVAEIASIKAPFLETLRALAGRARVASLHPLWGPDARVLSGKNLLVLDCGNEEAAREAAALFSGTAARIHQLPIEQHDLLMAYTLGLPHALNLLFGEVLVSSGHPFQELRALGGPTFLKQSAVAAEVASENRELYRQIQALNPHTPAILGELRAALDRFEARLGEAAAFSGRMDAYDRYFARFREWWP
jgi:chorismate mutase/prephenate dehydrogenase